jgi:hypothetical protein
MTLISGVGLQMKEKEKEGNWSLGIPCIPQGKSRFCKKCRII